MKNQWLDKSVDLRLLADRVKFFFPAPDFETTLEEGQKGYTIRAVCKIPKLRQRIEVKVLGQPDDFTVEFLSGGSGRVFSPSKIAGYLTSLFGGGYLVLRETQRYESLGRFESDFWKHVQLQVADLADSAVKSDE